MRTKYKKLTIVLFFLSLLILSSSCGAKPENYSEEMPLSEFIIGKWHGEKQIQDIHGKYTNEYFIEFINEDTLKFKIISPYTEVNAKFRYEFLNDTAISVENERAKGGKWNVARDDDKLLIHIWLKNEFVEFTRNDK